MQTPAGHEVRDGIAYPVDWLAIIFNPSFPYRLAHMLTAAYLTTSLVVLAVGARYLLAGRHLDEGRTMMRMGIGMLAVLAPLQLFIGDQHGLNTLEHQPIKIAAMEAHWDGSEPGDSRPLRLARREDRDQPVRDLDPARRGSLILTHDPERPVSRPEERAAGRPAAGGAGVLRLPHHGRHRPLDDRARAGRRVCCGGAARCSTTRWYLRLVAHTWWLGFVAVIAGWIVTESGRQPWIVYGILRTADAISPVPAASDRDDARPVRAGLRRRVRDGHLLHQPPDREGSAGPRGGAARERHAGAAAYRPPATPAREIPSPRR